MKDFKAYVQIQKAFTMAQKAHMGHWEVAKASISSATAGLPTHFATATGKAKDFSTEGAKWAREHPFQAAAYGTALVTVAAPGAVAAPVLALGGFGSNGIIGGKLSHHIH